MPGSIAEVLTTTLPSAPSRTLAVAAIMFIGKLDVAQPQPIAQSPSRIDPGRGSRRAQPNAVDAVSKHCISERLEYGAPVTGLFIVSLRRRSSTGSIASATASSSTALSRANMYGTSGGERMKPGVARSARSRLTFVAMLGMS